jgi:hypothetical protein
MTNLEEAKKISQDTKCDVIYGNSKNEFFTSLNLAQLSDKKENIKTFDFTTENAKKAADEKIESDAAAAAKLAAEQKESDDAAAAAAKALQLQIELVKKTTTKEDAESLLVGYEGNKEVKTAVDAQVAFLASGKK